MRALMSRSRRWRRPLSDDADVDDIRKGKEAGELARPNPRPSGGLVVQVALAKTLDLASQRVPPLKYQSQRFGQGKGRPPTAIAMASGSAPSPAAAGGLPLPSLEEVTEQLQSIVSVINNPTQPVASGWSYLFGGASATEPAPATEVVPPLPAGVLPEVLREDFVHYLKVIAVKYEKFQHNRREAEEKLATAGDGAGSSGRKKDGRHGGEGLVRAMQDIPGLFFQEDFALERPQTFVQACPAPEDMGLVMELQEKLSTYLDIIEVHLLNEISQRSDSFFEALGVLGDLQDMIHAALDHIHSLRKQVQDMDQALYASALRIKTLQKRRGNLLKLHQKLRLVENVSQARQILGLLLPSPDYAGCLVLNPKA
mmetsp:Transcript_19968/g.63541  ORF Transcript_19968/g.63541 Transcript_19968/m.63541 type:complete len:369 (-) Transcript_19968:25-1131(-)